MKLINTAIATTFTVLFAAALGASLPISPEWTMTPFHAFVTTPTLIIALAALGNGLYKLSTDGLDRLVSGLKVARESKANAAGGCPEPAA